MRTPFQAKTVAGLDAELAQLHEQRAASSAEIERLAAHEDELETADEVMSATAATHAARNRLRKLDAMIADLRERLELARDAARAKLRGELLAAFAPAARDFLAAARAAQEALGRTIAAREALGAAGFERDYLSLPIPPALNGSALLAPDLLDMFAAGLDPAPRAVVNLRQSTRAARPVQQKRTGVAIDVFTGQEFAQASARQPRLARRETAGEGEELFHLLRGILDHPRKGQMQAGDVVAMIREEALPLVRAGAGDFITAEEVARLDAGAAVSTRRFAAMEATQ